MFNILNKIEISELALFTGHFTFLKLCLLDPVWLVPQMRPASWLNQQVLHNDELVAQQF